MVKTKVEESINQQIQAEFFSFYLYLSMSSYFKNLHLDGFAHWFYIQAQEELIHALKLVNFLNERGGRVRLLPLDGPQVDWPSPADAVAAALEHEQYISSRINDLLDLATKEKDHATAVLMHWYVNEQVEEEATAETLLHQVKTLAKSPEGLIMLDRELATRPAPVAGPQGGGQASA